MTVWALRPCVVVLAASALMVAGCSTVDGAPPAPSSVGSPATTLASREVSGGLCPSGPCLQEFEVRTDGSWALRDEDGPVADGRLTAAKLEAVTEAVAGMAVRTSAPATCAPAADGPETVYTWTTGGSTYEIAACDTEGTLPGLLDQLATQAREDSP